MPPYNHHLRQSLLLAMSLSLPACGPRDNDQDGFLSDADCNDSNAAIHPQAQEVCDGLDNNCDGVVDEDAVDRSTFWADADLDGHGDPKQPTQTCSQPTGHANNPLDCAPNNPKIHPGASENLDDRLDNNCNGMVDERSCPNAPTPKSVQALQESKGLLPFQFCIERSDDGTACPAPSEIDGVALANEIVGPAPSGGDPFLGSFTGKWVLEGEICGPDARTPDSCCYVFSINEQVVRRPGTLGGPQDMFDTPFNDSMGTVLPEANRPVHGRPLRVDGTPQTAESVASKEWSRIGEFDCSSLSTQQRQDLAEAWTRSALYEHASVASFARFTMDLMALQAPPELLTQATEAQADEVRHAQVCFAMASTFLGTHLGPGALQLQGSLESPTPESVLTQTILDACINETLAAAEAHWLSHQSSVEAIQIALVRIAQDEMKHATLGWKSIQWILEKHPELRRTAHATFQTAHRELLNRSVEVAEDDWMAAFGCMPIAESRRLNLEVWESVILPCAQALLNSSKDAAAEAVTAERRSRAVPFRLS